MRTIFRCIGAYSQEYLLILQFGAFWSTFSDKLFLKKKNKKNIYIYIYIYIYKYLSNIEMGARYGGRGKSRRSSLPPGIILLFGGLLATCSP